MRLVNILREPLAVNVLYDLLKERPRNSRISHAIMPPFDAHRAFVLSRPYRYWYLIKVGREYVGDLHCTDLNEIGIFLFERFRTSGYGRQALELFIDTHKPLHAIISKRVNRWLANIAPANMGAKNFFRRMGFQRIQETWIL